MPPYPDIPQYTQAASPEEAQEMKATYEQALQDCANALGLRDQLKTQMLKAVPDTSIKRLKDSIHGYADIPPSQLLEHLLNKYGLIEPEDLENNLNRLSNLWDTGTNLENVFTNAVECQQYAIFGEDPISEPMLVRKVLGVLQVSGVFVHEIKEWNNKPKADKTFANLETFFEKANKNRLLSEQSLKETLAANKAQAKPTPPEEATTPEHPGYGYCHTHGFCKNTKHTSESCKFPGSGHKTTATAANKQGGCATVFVPKNNVTPRDGNTRDPAKKAAALAAKATAKATKEAAQAAAQATAIAEAVKAALAAFVAEREA
jgi:hypothetical protein